MYRELIEKLTEKNNRSQLQGPCPENEIENAEEYVGFEFPEELKALLRETNGNRDFLLSAERIVSTVKTNREFYTEYFDEEEFEEKINCFLPFATNGCGDYYGYRILENGETDSSAIYIWEHELFEIRKVAKNISQLISKYYNDEI